ncbi:MAG: DNA repair protein RecN [Halofilum sp. (in: g-proteobacteria)]|nr:DNA repair protein RecN [Halofilum sp. (in: g-proteobacteria)]
MLKHIHIRDFAIIDELELELGSGMTALTGETGAGKSILLDALGLVLGDRADSQAVRPGAERAEIDAEFDIADHAAVTEWLAENDLDADGECSLRRVVGADGRSRGYINGRKSPLTLLRELGEQLVDIHGQHEHQSLLRRDAQRVLLDGFGRCDDALAAVEETWREWRDARARLERLGSSGEDRAERLELLRYQVEELDQLGLSREDIEHTDAEQRRLANAGQLIEGCQQALTLLYDDDRSAHGLLTGANDAIESLAGHDERLASAVEMIANALIQCDEAATALRGYAADAELDPDRLAEVEQRLSAIHELARKHRVEPTELPELTERLRAELDELEHADERAAEVEREVETLEANWRERAQALHAARERAGQALAEQVTAAMQELGMAGGAFDCVINAREDGRPGPNGFDEVEFRVTANPGQPLAPLKRVASGGELSRISLAIQMIDSGHAGIPTQIFDEVDAGIGGGVAAVVGDRLRALGAQRQVLCVTHLAQVAASAHHHLQVSKSADADETRARLQALAAEERIDEIARMLGGRRITDQSRAHARELLADG